MDRTVMILAGLANARETAPEERRSLRGRSAAIRGPNRLSRIESTPRAARTRPDGDDRGHGGRLEQRDAEDEQAKQRDDPGRPGEQHCAAGRVHRAIDGSIEVTTVAVVLAESGHDEQGVIDADAEAEQRRELRGEVGGVE